MESGEEDKFVENKVISVEKVKNIILEILKSSFPNEISNITMLKKGLTNNSFVFEYKNKKYIIRIPGYSSEKLINRKQETDVYNQLKGKEICENILYINSQTGYKLAEYYEDAREADSYDKNDIKICMKKLREFHEKNLKVEHEFNIFEKIDFYEKLFEGKSIYKDYEETKSNILSLKKVIDKYSIKKSLCHIDCLADNFLITKNDVILIDWEYAGMQDPHIDIIMFALYANYDKEQLDYLIDEYFDKKCSKDIRIKEYCYMAICGLLWSNWAEYKISLGEDLKEYSLGQYECAKRFYNIVREELKCEEI